VHGQSQRTASLSLHHASALLSRLCTGRLCRYAEPTFEEEEEVIDGDFSGSMFGLIDNDKDHSSKAAMGGLTGLDKALSKVRQELNKQLTKAGADSGLTSEVAAALGQVSGLASRLYGSATEPASA